MLTRTNKINTIEENKSLQCSRSLSCKSLAQEILYYQQMKLSNVGFLYDSGCSNRLCSVIKLFWLNFFCFQTTGSSSVNMLVPDCNLQLVVQMILFKILRKLEVNVVFKITQTLFWLTQSLGTRNRLITVSNYRCISSPTFISVVRLSRFMLCFYSI